MSPAARFRSPAWQDAGGVWVGDNHHCAIDLAGRGWCWGQNYSNQIDATGAEYPDPGLVSSTSTFSVLAPGGRHTCGLTAAGKIECWGRNEVGEVGAGTTNEIEAEPVVVPGDETWVSLSSSASTTCAVTDAGELLCWGFLGEEDAIVPGSEGCRITTQSKDGPSVRTVRCARTPLAPVVSPAMGDAPFFTAVSATCALTDAGVVGCYDSTAGQVEPVTGAPPFSAFAAYRDRACALTANGEAWCWGLGPLGDGGASGRPTPVPVSGGHLFRSIAVGHSHSCGVTMDEEMWCWGDNEAGQAGVSVLERPRTPMRVRGQG